MEGEVDIDAAVDFPKLGKKVSCLMCVYKTGVSEGVVGRGHGNGKQVGYYWTVTVAFWGRQQ